MSRIKSRAERRARKLRLVRRCPKCKSTDIKVTTYPDEGVELRVCQGCRFPVRTKVAS